MQTSPGIADHTCTAAHVPFPTPAPPTCRIFDAPARREPAKTADTLELAATAIVSLWACWPASRNLLALSLTLNVYGFYVVGAIGLLAMGSSAHDSLQTWVHAGLGLWCFLILGLAACLCLDGVHPGASLTMPGRRLNMRTIIDKRLHGAQEGASSAHNMGSIKFFVRHNAVPRPTHPLLGGTSSQLSPQPGHTNAPVYHEKQQQRFCLVHALNMELGSPVVDPAHVASYLERQHTQRVATLGDKHGLRDVHYGGQYGDFSTGAVNAFLAHQHNTTSPTRLSIRCLRDKVNPEILAHTNLTTILLGRVGCQVHYTKKAGGGRYGHAVAIVKDRDGAFWWCDSEEDGPIHITDEPSTWRSNILYALHGPNGKKTKKGAGAPRVSEGATLYTTEICTPAEAISVLPNDLKLAAAPLPNGLQPPPPAAAEIPPPPAPIATQQPRKQQAHKQQPPKASKAQPTCLATRKTRQTKKADAKPLGSTRILLQQLGLAKPPTKTIAPATTQPQPSQRPQQKQATLSWTGLLGRLRAGTSTNLTPQPESPPPSGPTAITPTTTPATPLGPPLHVLLHNCRGLGPTNASSLPALQTALKGLAEPPSIIVLTETKLLQGQDAKRKQIRAALPDYSLHFSCAPQAKTNRPGAKPQCVYTPGRAGVLVGVHKSLAGQAGEYVNMHGHTQQGTYALLNGTVAHITLQLPGCQPLAVVGTYIPPGDEASRKAAYAYVRGLKAPSLLALGDWNAGLREADKPAGSKGAADQLHAVFAASTNLTPLGGENRAHTYTYQHQDTTRTSRIDDALIRVPGTGHPTAEQHTLEMGGNADHLALHYALPMGLLGLKPPPANPARGPEPPRLALPLPAAALTRVTARIAAELNSPIHEVYNLAKTQLDGTLQALQGNHTAANLHRISSERALPQAVETITTLLSAVMADSNSILYEECPKQPTPSGRHHMRGSKQKAFQREARRVQVCKALLGSADHGTPRTEDEAADLVVEAFTGTHQGQEVQRMAEIARAAARSQPAESEWKAHLISTVGKSKVAMAWMHSDMRKAGSQVARLAFQGLLAVRARLAHLRIFATSGAHAGPPTAVRSPATGQPTTDPATILTVLTDFFTKLLAPLGAVRTGKFLPEERPAGFAWPWERSGAPDRFTLRTPAQPLRDSATPLDHMRDRCMFDECLHSLKNSKREGIDGIPNELIKALPPVWHDTLHCLFQLCWISGHTPADWKTSRTILLYKKEDPLNPKNYRPIGLCNTVYKLWTSCATCVLATYIEATHMLSESQEGFRAGRNTSRQVRNLINALEDAHMHSHDVLGMYVDFSSAFNMVDGDTLLCLMYDMGLSADAVRVVAGIYDGASTVVQVPAGSTPPIPILRGTIQGDTLSPLLYVIYADALLRWLQVGGRGYRYGCLSSQENDRHNLAALGYADDTKIMVGGPKPPANQPNLYVRNLQVQTQKLELYAQATKDGGLNLPVNISKCAATGLLLASNEHTPKHFPAERAALSGQLQVGGQTIPFIPPSASYKYLGIHTNYLLDWTDQHTATQAEAKRKGRAIGASMASPRQGMRMLQQVVKPGVAYGMVAAPYSAADIDGLDRCLATAARKCHGLPRCFPTRAILAPTEDAGLGLESLQVDYVQAAAAYLTRALNDPGRLGVVTRALLTKQLRMLGGINPGGVGPRLVPHAIGIRQLAALQMADITVTLNGKPLTLGAPDAPSPQPCLGRLQALITTPDAVEDALTRTLHAPGLLLTLNNLGIKTLAPLLDSDGTHLIDTNALAHHFGARVTAAHRTALNRISLMLTLQHPSQPGVGMDPKGARRYKKTDALPARCRRLPEHPALQGLKGGHPNVASTLQSGVPTHTNPAPPTLDVRPDAPKPQGHSAAEVGWASPRKNVRVPAQEGTPEHLWAAHRAGVKSACPARTRFGSLARRLADADPIVWRNAVLDLLGDPTTPSGSQAIPAVLYPMYDNQEALAAIAGGPEWQKGSLDPSYLIRPQPTTICATHLRHFVAMGYNFDATEPHAGPNPPGPLELTDGLSWIKVTWALKWEPTTTLQNFPEFEKHLADYKQGLEQAATERREARTAPPPASDEHLTMAQRQGCWTESAGYNPALVRRIRESVTLDPNPRDPELDICPPGSAHHTVQVGRRLQGTTVPLCHDTAFVYDPRGRYVGSMTAARLAMLRRQHDQTRQNNPLLFAQLKGGQFEDDLAALLLRYPARAFKPATSGLATPATLARALYEGLGLTAERFATPLDCSPLATTYWAPQAADQLFGARHEAFSAAWSGLSQAFPPHDSKLLEKAVRQALHSAEKCEAAGLPSCTVFVMPARGLADGYRSHRSHPYWYEVGSAPKATTYFEDHYARGVHVHMNGGDRHAGGVLQQAKQDLHVFAICNPTAFRTCLQPRYTAFSALWHVAFPPAGHSGPKLHALPPAARELGSHAPTHAPRALGRLLRAAEKRSAMAPGMEAPAAPRPMGHATDEADAVATHPATLPLAVDPLGADARYTDGSLQDAKSGKVVGAAVYAAKDRRTLLVNPNGAGCTNDINRAELAAIHAALLDATDESQLTIYTDSLCSIRYIARMMNRPHTLLECKHVDLLSNIVSALGARALAGHCTAIYKVKAHAGVLGNELADAAAKLAGKKTDPDDFYHVENSDNDPRSKGAWCSAPPPPREGETQDPSPPAQHLGNLTRAVKDAAKRAGAGANHAAPQAGSYASFWATALPDLHKKYSFHMWADTALTWTQQKNAFKAWWGHLPNNKLEHRYGRSPHPFCPHGCRHAGAPVVDGATHILGGCQHTVMKAMYIERHNEATRLLANLILLGRAGSYVVADAGREDKLPKGVHATRLPTWLLPKVDPELLRKLRPDILLVDGRDAGGLTTDLVPSRQVTLIEVGYCSDTNHAAKHTHKAGQHAQLEALLIEAGWKVDYLVITLGTGGTIPSAAVAAVTKAGAPTDAIPRCMHKICRHAVGYVDKLHKATRALPRAGP